MDLLQFCSPSYDSFLPLSGVALIYVVLWHPTTAPNRLGRKSLSLFFIVGIAPTEMAESDNRKTYFFRFGWF